MDTFIIMPDHIDGIILIIKNLRDEALPRLYIKSIFTQLRIITYILGNNSYVFY